MPKREVFTITTNDLITLIIETPEGARAEVVGVLAAVPETVGKSRRAATISVLGLARPLEASTSG